MSERAYDRFLHTSAWRSVILSGLLFVGGALALLALLLPVYIAQPSLTLEVGDVAPQDIRAPRDLAFTSEVLTAQQQEMAAQSVGPIYSPQDTSIARAQVERLRTVLAFITNVRDDAYASREQKLADLAAMQDIQLSPETAEAILDLNASRWQVISQEAIVVLERVMRNTIRETQLEDARRSVLALVSLSIPVDQAKIVAELASAFVVPNSLYNEELTEAARQQARDRVEPVIRSFVAGETILERGRVVTAADLEALDQFGLLQTENRWQDLASAVTLVVLTLGFLALYLRIQPELTQDLSALTIIEVLYLIFLFGARLSLPGHTILPYLYPLPAFSLALAALFGTRYGLVFAIPLSIMVSYGLPDDLALTLYYLFGSVFGVMILGKAQRVTAFIWAGTAVAVTSAATVVVYNLPDPNSDLLRLATLSGAAVLNGVASASLAILLQFFLAQMIGLTTALQLLEILRSDHPLLQYILHSAPGTYQHSLQVANLAEQAAERIGADSLLTRVGALYHDAGKALNPYFFIENQPAGFDNPHNALDPYESAQIIIKHVPDGVELARKYHLPQRIHDFIREHHGTLITRYQYVSAVKAAGGDQSRVDKDAFRYPGPRPRSRETALVMLADGCEARVRAETPKTQEALREIIRSVIDARLSEGQLDHTPMTMSDLHEVADSFTATLRSLYHPRIEYPQLDDRPVPVEALPAGSATEPASRQETTSTAP